MGLKRHIGAGEEGGYMRTLNIALWKGKQHPEETSAGTRGCEVFHAVPVPAFARSEARGMRYFSTKLFSPRGRGPCDGMVAAYGNDAARALSVTDRPGQLSGSWPRCPHRHGRQGRGTVPIQLDDPVKPGATCEGCNSLHDGCPSTVARVFSWSWS